MADLLWQHEVVSPQLCHEHQVDSWPGRRKCHCTWIWPAELWWRHHGPWHHQPKKHASGKSLPQGDMAAVGSGIPKRRKGYVDLCWLMGFNGFKAYESYKVKSNCILGRRLFYSPVERQNISQDLLIFHSILSMHIKTHTHCLGCSVGSLMTHWLFSSVDWVGGCSHIQWGEFEARTGNAHPDMYTLTDSSRPGFRGLKLQEMTINWGLIGEELWNVHFRRTSVPFTASTSPDVCMRIPLTCSTSATYKHMAHQCLLKKWSSLHFRAQREKNMYKLLVG